MNILVLNSGSSTLTFHLFATDIERIAEGRDERLCRGQIERIGGEAMIVVQTRDTQRKKFTASLPDISASLEYLVRWIVSDASEISEVRTVADLHAVGNRLRLDDNRNKQMVGLEGQISCDDSSLHAFVIPTDEELLIARDTVRCILAEPGEHRAATAGNSSVGR
jgi:acetate kinase